MYYNDMRDLIDVTTSSLRKQIRELQEYTSKKVRTIEANHKALFTEMQNEQK